MAKNNDKRESTINLNSEPKYQNSTENLLADKLKKNNSSEDKINFNPELLYHKNKTSIFGTFYRKEKDKKKNNSIKTLPEIKQEIDSLHNKKPINKEYKKNIVYVQPTINDINIDENKKKSLNPIFLTELFKEFDKRTNGGIIRHKIKILHMILNVLIFFFLFFEIINHFKSRNIIDFLLEDGKKKNLTREDKLNIIINRKNSKMENNLRILNTIIVIFCEIILLIREYYVREYDINDYSFKERISDFIIGGIFFPPFINPVILTKLDKNTYPIICSNIVFILSLSKILFFLKYNSLYSKWNSSISKNVSKTLTANSGHLFVLQSRIKEYSFMYLILIIISTIILSAVLIRTAEYLTFDPDLSEKVNNELCFNSILDSIWTTIMISFGVAYGDIYPRTFLGRTIIILTTIVGYIVISKLLVTFMKYLTLTDSEKKVFLKMKRLTSPQNQLSKGIKVIRDILTIRKYLIIKDKVKDNKIKKIEAMKHLSILLLFLYNDNKNFMDLEKIDESYKIPVDDILKGLIKKIEDNLKGFDISFNKLEPLNIQLQELMAIQSQINLNLQKSIESQRESLNYLTNVNNSVKIEKLKLQFLKRKNASSTIKNNLKCEESIFIKRLSETIKRKSSKHRLQNDDDMFILGKKNNKPFKLNFTKVNIIREEHNNEEGSVANSPYLKTIKETKVVKPLPSKFDNKQV